MTSPLLTDASGVKFGKSEGNAIWLSADMTSPYAFYQYFLNIEDASVITLLKVFSDRGQEDIAELERQVAEEPFRRAAQKALAGDMVTLVHGSEAYAAVLAASEALFGRGDLRPRRRHPARRRGELNTGPVAGMPITEALVAVGLVEPANGWRVIADGGASVNGTEGERRRVRADRGGSSTARSPSCWGRNEPLSPRAVLTPDPNLAA